MARKHVRALLVTGDGGAASQWARTLRDDLSLDERYAPTLRDALAVLQREGADVALVGNDVADGSFRDLLRELQVARDDLPVIVVADADADAMREAMNLGAADVVAPGDMLRLGHAVVRALREAGRAALLRRTRAETMLLDETLRRTRDDLVVVSADDEMLPVVYATRPDLIGRPLADLPFVRDGEEAEELAAAVLLQRSGRMLFGAGSIAVDPLALPPYDRRYVAITLERDGRSTSDDRDPVTGLPQRAAFERLARTALAEAERDGASVVMLFLDVDRFHVINELGDHAAGDAVLREIARRLRDACPDAVLARFGGDEFVLLRVEHREEIARDTVDGALATFAMPFTVAEKPVFLTASVGVAHAPDDASDVPALIGTAEAAVFEAKRLGRNNARWYRSQGVSSSIERVLTRRDLHGAIARDEFDLYYQPMYDIETRALHGVEALLRWRHPVHGIVSPDRFIPVAEEFGLIEEIGAWVLDRAIAQVREWSDLGIPSVRVSVNVSARQFESDALPPLVADLLARHGVAASCLELEITESSIMRDVAAAARLLRALRDLGVRVSIDDFGTGYTSLGFLKRFPVDMLKIDRTFVADVLNGTFDCAVVRAVTTLARGLGVRTVAEGVEEQAQLERLRALDCDVVQGFLFCHPLTVAACTPVLRAGRVF